jgi:hypothetical protein
VLIEAHDEWQVDQRRYLSEETMNLLHPPPPTAITPRHAEPVTEQPALQTA